MRVPVTEYLEIDLATENWCCRRCGKEHGPARSNYKEFLLVRQRSPYEVHNPYLDPSQHPYTLSPNPDWCRIVEFYCPQCAVMAEVEYLPLGHPPTHDLELDLENFKRKHATARPQEGNP